MQKQIVRSQKHSPGIALIEALISVLVLSLGILAISKLNVHLMNSAGVTRSKTEAIQIAQSEIEERRAKILKASFDGMTSGTREVTGKNAVYDVEWNVSLASTLAMLTVTVSWTSAWSSATKEAIREAVSIDTLLNWTNPQLLSHLVRGIDPYAARLDSPTGTARRPASPIKRSSGDPGVYAAPEGKNMELRDAEGNVLLILEPDSDGTIRKFATISGRVYFDTAAKQLPSPRDVFVTATAQGHCFRSDGGKIEQPPAGINGLRKEGDTPYYDYTCYVGEGWRANIGVYSTSSEVDVCLGDPVFSGSKNDWTTLPIPQKTSHRIYRGYKHDERSASGYRVTGIAGGGQYPNDGMPTPSHFSESKSLTPDHFNHHFLVTRLPSDADCARVMQPLETVFSRNAGAAFCLSPDDDSAEDKCPKIWPGWPGFEDAAAGDFEGG